MTRSPERKGKGNKLGANKSRCSAPQLDVIPTQQRLRRRMPSRHRVDVRRDAIQSPYAWGFEFRYGIAVMWRVVRIDFPRVRRQRLEERATVSYGYDDEEQRQTSCE